MWFLILIMAIQTIVELELNGRGAGWSDVSADLADSPIEIDYGIRGNSVADRVASTGTGAIELVNQNPQGKYSLRHTNKTAGFDLGIGVRIRLLTNSPGGTGSGYLVNNVGGYPAGTKTVAVDTGTGSINKGDLITFAGVSGKYIVTAGGDPATSVTFEPGLSGSVADDAAVSLVGRNFTRFRGRLDSVQPIAGIYERRTSRCVAVDWMDDAARAKVSGLAVQIDKRPDEVFEELVNSVPFAPDAIEVQESPDTYPYALDNTEDEKSTVLNELQKLALSELAVIYQKADGTVVFESRINRAKSSGSVDTFEDVSSLSGFDHAAARNDTISRIQLITHPRRVDSGNTTVLFRLDNPVQVGSGSTATILGPYRDPNQEASRVGGTDMQTPVAGTDYSANSKSDGTGTDLTSQVSLAVNFGGNGAKVTIQNNAPQTAWITLLQLRGRGIYDYQNVVAEAEDATSQVNIGTTVTADMPYQNDPIFAEEAAIWLLSVYAEFDRTARTATVFVPRSDEDFADRVLVREISDRIGIVEAMTGFDGSDDAVFFIQSVSLTIDARDNLSISWGLAPVNTGQFWLLEVPGQSELDNTTILGFGLVTGHADVPHSDIHGDTAHTDVAHADSHTDDHGDTAHGDSTHTDSHDDVAHSDVAHSDNHGDTSHSDTAHTDNHSDVVHEDSHSDVAHDDTLHIDQHTDYTDDIHLDFHSDIAHSDVDHSDSHTDTAHTDDHGDVSHDDVAHVDTHGDSAHSDVNHTDTHGDAGHSDQAHVDTHDDVAHADVDHDDVAHEDEHADTEHGDQQI